MQRLSPADAAFIYMETPLVHMHVTGVLIIDPSTSATPLDVRAIRDHLAERVRAIPTFRRRLLTTPLGIDHPVWVNDPDLDIDRHVHVERLRRPGRTTDLATYVGNYAAEQLDRSRPLWDMVILDGLADGTIAVITKMHHSAVDGVTGNDLMAQLVDLTPDAAPTATPDLPAARPVPGPVGLVFAGLRSRALDPLRTVRAAGRTAGSLVRLANMVLRPGAEGGGAARPFDAPRTAFNRSLTPRRSVAFAHSSLDDLRFIKATFGATVNDAFLAACTLSLRRYLVAGGERCDRPLVASVPISVHGASSSNGAAANQVSNMFVRLPVNETDPVEVLRRVAGDTRDAKRVHGAIGADMIGDVTELTPPGLFNLAVRTYSRAGLAERLPPIHNLVVSNVPGPPIPLYVAGAQVAAIYPFGPLLEGCGLNISVLSNMGHVDIGVIACPDIAPRVDDVASGIVDAIAELRAAANAALREAR
ncbi:MAG: wax ester/triacylglycerol synthase family O-acyltransferase [Microthrixaceae bacterium]|nr:wax ester/triacylglycerol synthase family O-acyltransferase [Microthrixaceae bacterium]